MCIKSRFEKFELCQKNVSFKLPLYSEKKLLIPENTDYMKLSETKWWYAKKKLICDHSEKEKTSHYTHLQFHFSRGLDKIF